MTAYEPIKHALAAIEAARAEDQKRRSKYTAQMWETARRSTAVALRDLLEDADIWGSLSTTQTQRAERWTMADALQRLDAFQAMVTGELLILLNHIGYEPPPPTGEFVEELERKIGLVARRPNKRSVDEAKKAVETVLERVTALEGKSVKRVRRELSPLRRRLLIVALGLQVVMAPAIAGASSEIGKSFVRDQIAELVAPSEATHQQQPKDATAPD